MLPRLGLSNNSVTLPSTSKIYMPSLTFLDIASNNMTIRGAIGKDSFPLLTYLYVMVISSRYFQVKI